MLGHSASARVCAPRLLAVDQAPARGIFAATQAPSALQLLSSALPKLQRRSMNPEGLACKRPEASRLLPVASCCAFPPRFPFVYKILLQAVAIGLSRHENLADYRQHLNSALHSTDLMRDNSGWTVLLRKPRTQERWPEAEVQGSHFVVGAPEQAFEVLVSAPAGIFRNRDQHIKVHKLRLPRTPPAVAAGPWLLKLSNLLG